ncbi:MAG: hypothetical protein HDR32_07495 [Treponema sp.]|nr:hypothetical protein [Treponema sp.]
MIPLIENRKNINFNIQRLLYWNKEIRVSMSYVYRICVDDKYLLVQNSHRKTTYQFVGGKYKYYKQSESELRKLKMRLDDKLGQGFNRKNDIAFFIPAKNLKKFIDWFDSQIYRDIDCTREFREELLQDKKTQSPVLDEKLFADIKFMKICTVKTPITQSPADSGWKCLEYKQYDVLEPMFTKKQEEALRKLASSDSDYVKWVTKDDINSLGHKNGAEQKAFSINEHTKWCLSEEYSNK